jgi:glycosyltransferase involved in cell wall biosynthesis
VNVHGVTGYLSNVGDVADMANNAIKMLENEEVLKTFKRNALQRAREFDLDKIMNEYLEIYKRCIAL